MLERMDLFFERRLEGYEQHMLTAIESAPEFYSATANALPKEPCSRLLDLGCGTGLELNWYFERCPSAEVTCVDLSSAMLAELKRKFSGRTLRLILGSYFDVELGREAFDAAVSVESLHHFTRARKEPLYTRLCRALKPSGLFVLTDYFAPDDAEEEKMRAEYEILCEKQGLGPEAFYHYDTPLTVEHEIQALRNAGFASVEVAGRWGDTAMILAGRE